MRRQCPAWFQERLAQIGGRNPYGEPRFKLVWGESETMRDGGYFKRDGYLGYRDVPALGGEACWALMMWEPAIMFGIPYSWYKHGRDEYTGLVTLGQYPHHGRYRLIKRFVHRERVGDQWVTTRMEPNQFILDVMVPLIIQWRRFTDAKKLSIIQEKMQKQEDEYDRILDDSRSSHRVRRDSPIVQKRLELMERTMSQAMAIAARTQTGMRQMGV